MRLRLLDFQTSSYLGSLEYGFCENLDLYVRLGVTSAEGDIRLLHVYGFDEETGDLLERDDVPTTFDFGSGFSWQIGTAFTICRSGAWTWGGRMQFGMVQGDSDSFCQHVEETVAVGETVEDVRTYDSVTTAELDWWQAVAYVGPTYQLSDALSVYAGGGWQTLHGTLDIDYTDTGLLTEVDSTGETPVSTVLDGWRERGEGTITLKHASAIGVFGAAWSATSNVNIGVDALIGEAGKWGIGVSGAFAF
ncbi:MAG: hypothetical protein ABFE13_10205 [Phycisphaerales bacterium]